MERITISKFGIGILQGKKARYNKLILKALYRNGPLTQWEISKHIRRIAQKNAKINRKIEYASTQMIQSVVSRRLKKLSIKKYVLKRKDRKWTLHLKGVIAILIMEPKPKPWSEKWHESWAPKIDVISEDAPQELRSSLDPMKEALQDIYKDLKNFNNWVELANRAKALLNKGVINLDFISNDLLFTLLIWEPKGKEGFLPRDFRMLLEAVEG